MIERASYLNSARDKAKWAYQHILYFADLNLDYVDNKAYKVVEKQNPDSGDLEFFLVRGNPPPSEISFVVGDAVHNLRSSLDHLVCACMRLRYWNCKCAGKKTRVQFPVYTDPKKFDKRVRRGAIGKAVPYLVSKFERFQPYTGGDGKDLFTLHQLDIKDKHRSIILVGDTKLFSADIFYDWGAPDESIEIEPDVVNLSVQSMSRADGGPIQIPDDGSEFLTSLTPRQRRRHPEFKIDLHPIGDIAFSESGPLNGKPVLMTLIELSKAVNKIIEAFAPEFVGVTGGPRQGTPPM